MKYIIWDFDGTLAYREGLWSGTLAEVVSMHHPAVSVRRESFVPYLSSGFFWHDHELAHPHITSADAWWMELAPVLTHALCQGAGLSLEEAQGLLPEVRARYVAPARWRVYPDTVRCLSSLSGQGWAHMVLSNHVPELRHIIEALGLKPHIAEVFNSAETGYEKPHPQAFRGVLSVLRDPAVVWMVGDSYTADVAGAEAAGVSAILVRKRHPLAAHFYEDLDLMAASLGGLAQTIRPTDDGSPMLGCKP